MLPALPAPDTGLPMMVRLVTLIAFAVATTSILAQPAKQPLGLRFQVKIDPKQVGAKPQSGRLLVGIARKGEHPDFTNYKPPVLPMLGTDAEAFTANKTFILDANSECFPLGSLNALPFGEYAVQAVFLTNTEINLPDAPGNRYCEPITVKLDPANNTTVALTLNKAHEDD